MVSMKPEILKEMNTRIEQIEKQAMELQELGRGLPVIEMNMRTILGTVYVLKFGISDIAQIDAMRRR